MKNQVETMFLLILLFLLYAAFRYLSSHSINKPNKLHYKLGIGIFHSFSICLRHSIIIGNDLLPENKNFKFKLPVKICL